MKRLFKVMFILALVLCFTIPAFAIKLLPYNMPLQDIMRWDKYGLTLKLSNPEGERMNIAWPASVDLWNYDGKTWTYDLPDGDTFAFGKGVLVGGTLELVNNSITVTKATGIGVHSIVTAVDAYTGWALGFFGQALISNTAGNAANAAGGVFEVNVTAAMTGGKTGIWAGIYAGAFANSTTAGSLPTAGIIVENIAGATVDMSTVPLMTFMTSGGGGAGGAMSQILFEIGNAEAAKTVGTLTTEMFYRQTLKCVVNATDYFILMSTVEGTYTTLYPIDVTVAGATAIDIGTSAIGIDFTGTFSTAEIVGTAIEIDAGTSVSIQAAAGTFDFVATSLEMNALTITEAGNITSNDNAGFALLDEAAAADNPTLIPDRRDFTTGIGFDSPEIVTIVLGGTEEYSFSGDTFDMNTNTITEAGTITGDNAASYALVNEAVAIDNPTLCPNQADLTTGIGFDSPEVIVIVIGGTEEYNFDADDFDMNANTMSEVGDVLADDAQGFALMDEPASVTNPTLVPDRRDESTGIGFDSPEVVVVVLGGVEEYSFDTADFDMNDNTFSEVGLMTSSGGIVLEDGETVAYGDDSDVGVGFDTGRTALATAPLGNFVSPEGMSDRFRLEWVAGQRGKPGMNADIADSSVDQVTSPDFEILGTNANSEDVTFYAEGGITFETDGADSDEVILVPHLTANQSAWEQVSWGTENEVRWETSIRTDSPITTCIIWAGLKLTNTSDSSEDANQAFFRYEDDINDGEWEAISSIGGSHTVQDTGVEVLSNTVYHLVIEIDSGRLARFYINGSLVETSGALTGAIDLIPYIGIEEDGAGDARKLHIRGQVISRTAD